MFPLSAPLPGRMDAWLARIDPADRERARTELIAHLEGRTAEYFVEYRFVGGNGTTHWLLCRGKTSFGPHGRPRRMLGAVVDIVDRKRKDQELARYVDALEAA